MDTKIKIKMDINDNEYKKYKNLMEMINDNECKN